MAAVLLSPAAAAAGDRQTVSASYSTTLPGAAVGNRLVIDWRNPADPAAKPYAVDTIVIQLPPGSRFDFSALPQCKASDAELLVQGAAGCPPESKVNSGEVLSDTGSPGGFPRFVHTRTVNFNNEGELVGIGDAQEVPFRSVLRSKIKGETITIPVPDNPGNPPPDNFTAFKRLFTDGPPIARGNRVYARTPPTCPAAGYWTTRYTFLYHDGVRQTETTRSPCRRSANPCLAARAPVGRRGIGRIRLGRRRPRLLSLPVRPPRSRGRSLSWCVRRSRGRVTAVFDRGGRVQLVTTTAGGHGNRGVHPGSAARRLASAYPRRRRLARGIYRATPRGRQVIGVRAGRIRFLGVAARRLLAEPQRLRAAIRRAL
jgi:hypothetical protein